MILVTGGTGFVGRHLVRALSDRDAPVRVLTRGMSNASLPGSVGVARGDLAEPASLGEALRGVDTVIHLAARVGSSAGDDGYAFNVRASETIARAAREAGVRRFVHVSSGGVYGDGDTAEPHREADRPRPATAYEKSKLESEQAVLNALSGSAVSWVILRPAGIYGAERPATIQFYSEVRTRRFWVHSSPNVIVHPTHVSDVVQACVRVMDRPNVANTIINVAGERAVRLQDLIARIGQALGVRPTQLVMPRLVGAPIAIIASGVLRAVGAGVPTPIERMRRAHINRALDTSRARELLGFVPFALEAGVREAAAAAQLGG